MSILDALLSKATRRGVWKHLHFHDRAAEIAQRHRQVFIPINATEADAEKALSRYLTESFPRMFPGADLAACDCPDVPRPPEDG
mgnify:FL=1